MTRVYAPEVQADARRVVVSGDEAHHLSRVVRVRVGETVGVFDGRGREFRALVSALDRHGVTLDLQQAVTPVAEPPVRVTLAVGVLKGDQMDTVVRDATVMGAAVVIPLATEHVVVPARAWREDGAHGRWHRVAVAAAKQCGRAVVPEIATVMSLTEVVRAAAPGPVLACIEPAAAASMAASGWAHLAPPTSALLLVGPEGGWSAAEIASLASAGAHAVSLGPRTLRAEATPAVALTMIWSAWGWV